MWFKHFDNDIEKVKCSKEMHVICLQNYLDVEKLSAANISIGGKL